MVGWAPAKRGVLAPASQAVSTAWLPVSGVAAACHAGRACSAAAGAAPQPVAPGPFPAACRGSPSWQPPKCRERPAWGWAPVPGAVGRAAPPWARGGTSPTPTCRRHSVAWHSMVGLGWVGLTWLSVAWHGLVVASATCHCPPWLGMAQFWQHQKPQPRGGTTSASPRLQLLDSYPTVTQQYQCHPTAWLAARAIAEHGVTGQVAAPEMPLLPAPCLQVVRVMGSPFLPVLAPQKHVGPWWCTIGTTVGAQAVLGLGLRPSSASRSVGKA